MDVLDGSIGSDVGFAAGLGMSAIPGRGSVTAYGWAAGVGAMAGSTAGGLVDAPLDADMRTPDARACSGAVRLDGTLVSAPVADPDAAGAQVAVEAHAAIGADEHAPDFPSPARANGDPGISDPERGASGAAAASRGDAGARCIQPRSTERRIRASPRMPASLRGADPRLRGALRRDSA